VRIRRKKNCWHLDENVIVDVHRETERQQLAVKTVFKTHIEDGIRLSKLNCELSILRRLKHENLIELIDEFDNPSLHCIVMPLYVVQHLTVSSSSSS